MIATTGSVASSLYYRISSQISTDLAFDTTAFLRIFSQSGKTLSKAAGSI